MAKSESIFKRYELKYLLNKSQYDALMKKIEGMIMPDEFGESTICSLYYDTPEKTLIRRSLEKPEYKEKLRLRSYGIPDDNTKVYVELKKKYEDIVYKRRVGMKYTDMIDYLENGKDPVKKCQITNEIDYFFKFYKNIEPSMLLFYDRRAWVAREDENVRITFDRNILYRENDLSLKKGVYGTRVIDKDQVLLELKVAGAIPLWLVRAMNELKIYKTSFSKYGTAYAMSENAKKNKKNERKCS